MWPFDWIRPLEWTRALPGALGYHSRRAHVVNGRAHIELRALAPDELAAFEARLRDTLCYLEGVQWVCVNPALARAVVAFDADVCDLHSIVKLVERVERELGVAGAPFPIDRPEHPGDLEPLLRCVVELGTDVAGVGLALVGQMVRAPTLPFEIDVLAVLALFDVPRMRAWLDEQLGRPATNLGLAVTNATLHGLAQSPLGPMVDVVYRVLVVSERAARRRAWTEREGALFAGPAPLPPSEPDHGARPLPVSDGPIERYADAALAASLGAFGFGVVATGSILKATAPLFGGLPKPARLGREAFAAHFARVLAARGILPMDPDVLRRLDRIDCLVIDGALLHSDADGRSTIDPGAELLVAAARATGMRVLVATDDATTVGSLSVDGVVPGGARLGGEIRRLQQEHRVVALAATGATNALAAADCGIGLVRAAGSAPPWHAHLLCGDTLDDVRFVVQACRGAREVAHQSVMFAAAGAGMGLLISFGGLSRDSPGRVMTAVNLATLAAMMNGVRVSAFLALQPSAVRRDTTPWHALNVDAVLARLRSTAGGLAMTEALRRHVPLPASPSALARLVDAVVDQLRNPLTPLLAVGAGLSAVVGSVIDAALIASVMGLNALVGGMQRVRTDDAISGLGAHEGVHACAVRDGRETIVNQCDLVPGDVIVLRTGDAVPADCRLLEATALEVDESSLTGESLPVAKSPASVTTPLVAERASMVYEGTSIAGGEARAVVVAVGDVTEARYAAESATKHKPRDGVEARLESIAAYTVPAAVLGGAAIATAGALRGRAGTEVIGTGVSLAVAALPEGLPLLAMTAQLAAAHRLSTRGALVRNPRAVEALGRVNVVCVDKTGTVTEGHIRVRAICDARGTHVLEALDAPGRAVLAAALRATPAVEEVSRLTHATDRAIARAGGDIGITLTEAAPGWHRIDELPFEPARGLHATLGRLNGTLMISVKGAPEVVIARCRDRRTAGGSSTLDIRARERLHAETRALAGAGARVLAVAERTLPLDAPFDDRTATDLTFLGFIALRDTVRPTASDAVAGLRAAGVDVVMVTGDHPSTAEHIADELGLAAGNDVITGAELDVLDDRALDARVTGVRVFARVTPTHKVRIVEALQRAGRVVAMTGDGANDAPAIRLADVGIALGRRAAPAARDAADVVVTDDRIETIVDAILEGRAMWTSVRDAVSVLVGGNLGEVAFTVGAGVLGGGSPLNVRQLLLVNLLTDIAPAMAIALRPPPHCTPEQLLHEGPQASLGAALDDDIARRAVVTSLGTGAAWIAARATGSAKRASTVALATLVGTQLGQTLAAGGRSRLVLGASVGSMVTLAGIIQTPGLSQFFGCTPLGPVGWLTATTATGLTVGASVLAPRILPALSRPLSVAIPSWVRAPSSSSRVIGVAEAQSLFDWLTGHSIAAPT